ncbi:MAG: ATP-binding cassette domain-containing protein [Planctomycetes bacterium]|nr:ATP-binding cassette domain-containing protein [Planctomycetota bacterium]
MIEVDKLSRLYGGTVAVDQISFRIEKGEVVGFLGPNGAGKTTTMKMLTGYLFPSSGSARVDGIDVVESPLEVKCRIGYLPENAPLYTDMTVLEYLRFVADVRQIPRNARRSAIAEVAASCGVEPVIGKVIGTLSKGFRQRTCLAQALLHKPDVLILDEPTTGLDPNQILEIRQLIRDLGKERTVMLSTHILPEVEAVCSRVLIIHLGKIVADGTPETLQRQVRKGDIVRLCVRGNGRDVEKELLATPEVASVKLVSGSNGDILQFEVTTGVDRSITEDLFRLAVARGWTLSELRAEQASLEDVFAQLTTKEGSS